jgi:sulfite reductase alpha subunit-like flavoprotein
LNKKATIPVWILEDLPTMKSRYYSIVSDPYFAHLKKDEKEWISRTLRVCFTLHKFKNSEGIL